MTAAGRSSRWTRWACATAGARCSTASPSTSPARSSPCSGATARVRPRWYAAARPAAHRGTGAALRRGRVEETHGGHGPRRRRARGARRAARHDAARPLGVLPPALPALGLRGRRRRSGGGARRTARSAPSRRARRAPSCSRSVSATRLSCWCSTIRRWASTPWRATLYSEIIGELADRGTTVFLTSHDLAGDRGHRRSRRDPARRAPGAAGRLEFPEGSAGPVARADLRGGGRHTGRGAAVTEVRS